MHASLHEVPMMHGMIPAVKRDGHECSHIQTPAAVHPKLMYDDITTEDCFVARRVRALLALQCIQV